MSNQNPGDDFDIPDEWVGQKIAISYAFPMVSPGKIAGNGLNFPTQEGTLVRNMASSIVLLDVRDSVGEVLIPKCRIWNIVCRSAPLSGAIKVASSPILQS